MSKEPLKIRVDYDDGPEAVSAAIESICAHFNIPCSDNSEEHEYIDYVIGEEN